MEDTVTIQRCHSRLIITRAKYRPDKHVLIEENKKAHVAKENYTWKGKTSSSSGFSKKSPKKLMSEDV